MHSDHLANGWQGQRNVGSTLLTDQTGDNFPREYMNTVDAAPDLARVIDDKNQQLKLARHCQRFRHLQARRANAVNLETPIDFSVGTVKPHPQEPGHGPTGTNQQQKKDQLLQHPNTARHAGPREPQ